MDTEICPYGEGKHFLALLTSWEVSSGNMAFLHEVEEIKVSVAWQISYNKSAYQRCFHCWQEHCNMFIQSPGYNFEGDKTS